MVLKNFIEKYKLDKEDIEFVKEEEKYCNEKENEEFFEEAVNNLKIKNKLFSIRTNVKVLDKIKNIANNNV